MQASARSEFTSPGITFQIKKTISNACSTTYRFSVRVLSAVADGIKHIAKLAWEIIKFIGNGLFNFLKIMAEADRHSRRHYSTHHVHSHTIERDVEIPANYGFNQRSTTFDTNPGYQPKTTYQPWQPSRAPSYEVPSVRDTPSYSSNSRSDSVDRSSFRSSSQDSSSFGGFGSSPASSSFDARSDSVPPGTRRRG